MIRLLVADDQNLVRHALQVYLETEKDLEVVGSAKDGQTTLEQIEALAPDVVLLDIEMPGMNGLNTTQIICQRFPATKVLVLSSHDDEYYINQALQMGAKGYLLKNTAAEDLANVIRSVHKGYFQLGPGLSEKLVSKFQIAKNNPKTEEEIEEKFEFYLQELQKEMREKLEENSYNILTEVASQMQRFQGEVKKEINNNFQSLDSSFTNEELLEQQRGIKAQVLTVRGYYKELEKKVEGLRTALTTTIIVGIVLFALTLFYNLSIFE